MQLALLQPAPSKIVPYPYQEAAVDAVFRNWDERPSLSQLIVAPTGSGKTIMIGMSAERYPGRILVLTHVPELVEQNYSTFRKMCPDIHAGVYAAKLDRKDQRAQVTYGLVQSVARNIKAFRDVGLIIIDEAHLVPHSSDGQYRAVIDGIRQARGGSQFVKILGLTATPWRLNSGNLVEPYKDQPPLFDEIAYEIDMLDLIEDNKLCPAVPLKTKIQMDVAGVHKRGGEFIDGELNEKLNTDTLNAAIARETVTAGVEQGRKSWLVFCITVDHAKRMAELIRGLGIECEAVWGDMPTADRRRIIAHFKAFRLRCLVSVNVLGTGFDHKAVDLICLARPTASPGLYLQQAGRGMRIYPGKSNFLVLDFAANVLRHGLLTNVKGVFRKNKKDEDAEAEVKACPSCALIISAGSLTCPGCGHVFGTREAPDREAKLHGRNMADRIMEEASGWVTVTDAMFLATQPYNDKPSMLRLTYAVHGEDGKEFKCSEIFCFDHPPQSWAKKQAQTRWRQRTRKVAPETVQEAVARIEELERPSKVRVAKSDCGRFWNVRGIK